MKSNRNFFIPTALFIFITSLVLNGCGAEQTPANLQIGAINTLRTQLELPKTPLEFVEMTTDANSPATMLVAVYQDMDGRRFSVDPVTYQVVEMDARALLAKVSPLATVLSEEQIRTKALNSLQQPSRILRPCKPIGHTKKAAKSIIIFLTGMARWRLVNLIAHLRKLPSTKPAWYLDTTTP